MGILIEKSGDRRDYSRVDVDFSVLLRSTGETMGNAVNLSSSGMFIKTHNRLDIGAKLFVEFSLTPDTHPVKAYCNVKWNNYRAHGPKGVGVKFIGVYESGLNTINRFIEKSLKKVDSDILSLADFVDIKDTDAFTKTELFWEFIEDTNLKDFNKYGTPLKTASMNRVVIRDKKSGQEREVIMMGTSNYLGLTTHPKVLEAAKKALEEHGTGTASVRLLSGTHEMHQVLERKLADLKDTDDAAVFPTGHMANMGCISSLLGKKDIAFIDKNVHASILDGCGLSMGTFRTFRHSDIGHLRILLKRAQDSYLGKLIIFEGVDGIDGDLCPLPEICELAEEFGAKIMIDEAHATGVIGENGKGTASHFNLEDKVHVYMDSLSKAIGSLGGYIASSPEIIRYIKYYARTSFFSVSAPIPLVAAALTAIDVMETEPEIITSLRENIKYMKENLVNIGFDNVAKSDSAIMSAIIGDELTMRKMNKMIFEEGVYLEPIPYPAVPRGQERLRLRVMATHSREDLDKTLELMEKAGRKYGVLAKVYKIPTSNNIEEGKVQVTDGLSERRDIEIREVDTAKEIEESLKLAWKVYQDAPSWIPYFIIKDRTNLLLGKNNAYFKRNVISKRFVALENGETVGALSAFVDRRYTEHFGENTGFIGYFEAFPNAGEATANLLERAFEFLKSEGMTTVLAPVNIPLVLYGGGLLSGTYDKTPSLLQPYNLEYYHEYFLNKGFTPGKTLPHFTIDLSSADNLANMRSIITNSKVHTRVLNKSRYPQEITRVLNVYNEAYPRLWKYAPFKEDEFLEFAEEFKDLVLEGLWLISEVNGKDVAFAGGFPEAAPIFEKINGELGPSELASFPSDLAGIKEGAIVLSAVLEEYKDMGIGLDLLATLCINMAEIGYKKASCTWEVFDNNEHAEELIRKLGGVKDDFEWKIYERSLL